jgi:hypothetical protein
MTDTAKRRELTEEEKAILLERQSNPRVEFEAPPFPIRDYLPKPGDVAEVLRGMSADMARAIEVLEAAASSNPGATMDDLERTWRFSEYPAAWVTAEIWEALTRKNADFGKAFESAVAS